MFKFRSANPQTDVVYSTFWNDFTYYRFSKLGEQNDFHVKSESNILFSEMSDYVDCEGPVTYTQTHNGERIVEGF